jgi:hypothetical protein
LAHFQVDGNWIRGNIDNVQNGFAELGFSVQVGEPGSADFFVP